MNQERRRREGKGEYKLAEEKGHLAYASHGISRPRSSRKNNLYSLMFCRCVYSVFFRTIAALGESQLWEGLEVPVMGRNVFSA